MRKTYSGSEISCDSLNCAVTLTLGGSQRAEDRGWGIVRVYDGKRHRDEIGDQNGWNNYDLCPEHYQEQMNFLGIQAHNIPVAPEGEQ